VGGVEEEGCGRQGVLEVHFVVMRLEGFGWGEGLATAQAGADEDTHLLADGVVHHVEGVGMALSLQVRFVSGGVVKPGRCPPTE